MEKGRHGDGGRAAADQEPLVSVVIPAFNAADTVAETLASVGHQTYGNLEFIVVDDGSTDDTAAIVQSRMEHDRRVRLVRKRNGGVASARNAGIEASNGAFVAFIDADDLWHPTKIAKQMTVLLAASPSMALIYAPFRVIDSEGRVLASQRRIGVEGWVLYRHFHANLVGNGSSILVRKAVLQELGGFDTGLRAVGAEGCEDLLLQLRIAARYQFGEVPEYLVGYRRRPGSMSSDTEQMLRSGMLAVRTALAECAGIPHLSRDAILVRYEWRYVRSAVRRREIGATIRQFGRQFSANPLFAMILLGDDLMIAIQKGLYGLSRAACRQLRLPSAEMALSRHFYEFNPKEGIGKIKPLLTSLVFRRLARFDQTYRPKPAAATRPLNAEAASHIAMRLPPGDTAAKAQHT